MIPIFADPGSSTVLTYALQPIPNPFTASAAGAELPLAEQDVFSLVLMMTNGTPQPVTLQKIVVTLPCGESSNELSRSNDDVRGLFSDTADYSCPEVPDFIFESPLGWMQFTIKQALSGAPAALGAGNSLYLVVKGIATNPEPGVVQITVTEQLQGASSFGVVTLPLPVLPLGFYFNNLVALDESSPFFPSGVVAQVPHGTAVQLQWDTSVMDVTSDTFVVRYSTAAGEVVASVPVPGPNSVANSWVSPPLTADTVFTVVATQNLGASIAEQSFALSTRVAVADPDLVAGSLTVGGEAIVDTLSVTGTASVSGTASVTGLATLSGGMTVSGGSVSMLGPAQQLNPASWYVFTYSANTDGFVLAWQSADAPPYLTGSAGGMSRVTRESFLLPVQNGAVFTVQGLYGKAYFIPLGAPPAGTRAAEFVSKQRTLSSGSLEQRLAAHNEFIDALAGAVGRPITGAHRDRMLNALRRFRPRGERRRPNLRGDGAGPHS